MSFVSKIKIKAKSKRNIYDVVLSAIIGVAIVLSARIHFAGSTGLGIEYNYIRKIGLIAIPQIFLISVICFMIIRIADYVCSHLRKEDCGSVKKMIQSSRKIWIWMILMTIFWSLYYLTYFPGGVPSDTQNSISYYFDHVKTNRFPFLYNEIIGAAISIGEYLDKDLTWQIGLLTAAQLILLIAEFTYFNSWMIRYKVNDKLRICVMFFLTFFPIYPLYGVSVWKDTPFAMAFFLFMLFWIDILIQIINGSVKKKSIAKLIVGIFLVAFTRNNGIYAIIMFSFLFYLVTATQKYSCKMVLNSSLLMAIIAILIIQGPVYSKVLDSQAGTLEHLGIPIQQVAAVVVHNGKTKGDEWEDIGEFIPHDSIKEKFTPCCVDNLKWYSSINYTFFHSHTEEFIKLWIKLGLENPQIYFDEYLLQTCGFWDVSVKSDEGFLGCKVDKFSYWNQIEQTDFFEKI